MASLNEKAESTTADVKVKKYVCVNDCYYNDVVYNEGDTVEFPASAKIPEHFEEVK